ncbi:9642_t:CDS:2 [Cetraspora pellucida]|uniref:9642_t:CDS:1 n=1 Tax=Cetraspora pellucida TaxID=1433469 RepID=A0A9N8VK10_9GLOM|nr:9642_t:CDS:2 [Cetraspora pellucida]
MNGKMIENKKALIIKIINDKRELSFVIKVKCSFCSKKYFSKYHAEDYLCKKSLPEDDPRCWNILGIKMIK